MTTPKLPEGFTPWTGKPDLPPGAKVQVLFRGETEWAAWDWADAYDLTQDGDALDIVAYKVIEEAKPAPTGHPHAELMAQYAEDARTTSEPWTLWEGRGLVSQWEPLRTHPYWAENCQYRRKPKVCECCGQEIKE